MRSVFREADNVFHGQKIDLFYANAGFAYYEEFDYTDVGRIEDLFRTNTFSPMITYAKYLEHLDGREGTLAFTVSGIGLIALPGYAVYSASKFALDGFQQAVRLEKPDSLTLVCLYPIATDTPFFRKASPYPFKKPFPVQRPETVAKKMVEGLAKGKDHVSPSAAFSAFRYLSTAIHPLRSLYWAEETAKFRRFKKTVGRIRGLL